MLDVCKLIRKKIPLPKYCNKENKMKKLLNIFIAISFLLPILYFHLVWYFLDYLKRPSEFFPNNYFFEMSSLLNHWTTGEMGYFPIHFVVVGFALIIVKYLYTRQLRSV